VRRVSAAGVADDATGLERAESFERRKRLSFHSAPDGRQSPATLAQLCMIEIGRDLEYHSDDIPLQPPQLVDQLITFVVTNLQPSNQVVLDASVTLRVRFPDGRFLTMRFNTAQSVHDTKAQIFARFAPDSANAHAGQYALFQAGGTFTQPRWLADERALSFYDLRPGEELEFKQRQCLVRSKFLSPWETIKTFIVDATLPVYLLAETIAVKLGLDHPDEVSGACCCARSHACTVFVESASRRTPTSAMATEHALTRRAARRPAALLPAVEETVFLQGQR
jgi:hypothetical protein